MTFARPIVPAAALLLAVSLSACSSGTAAPSSPSAAPAPSPTAAGEKAPGVLSTFTATEDVYKRQPPRSPRPCGGGSRQYARHARCETGYIQQLSQLYA